MADAKILLENIREARANLTAQEAERLRSRQRVQTLTRDLEELNRQIDRASKDDLKLREQLQNALSDAKAHAHDSQLRLKESRQKLASVLSQFSKISNPVSGIKQFSADIPLLLFPVRLETRFKKVKRNNLMVDELWVRIYPDTCLIDTFEETLSEAELRNARRYWQQRWRAGGVEDDLLAAWSNLVSSHGTGRAEWIIQAYRPVNDAEEPKKLAAQDVVLVIQVNAKLPGIEQTAMEIFWRAMWQADGNPAVQQAAFSQLVSVVGQERAAAISNDMRPINFDENPVAPFKRSDVAVTVAMLVLPEDMGTKASGWTRAPQVNLLPNQFVLIGYQGTTQVLHQVGAPVVSPLVIGTDPSAPKSEQLHVDEEGNPFVPDEMKWMIDFEQAVSVGMGFIVTLTPQLLSGFDRLMVLGIRLESDEAEGSQHLTELLNHHHFGHSGLSLIPQGTATNNIEGQTSNYSFAEDPRSSFERLFQSGGAVSSPTEPLEKTDGHWLAEWLGINPGVFDTVAHSRGSDQCDARAMNLALWPATGDYFLRTMLHPIFSTQTLDHLRWFFTRYVSGRGPIPAIRIGKQPYGILPTTAFSKIDWNGTTKLVDSERLKFVTRLVPVLKLLDQKWAAFQARVSSVASQSSDPHQTLLNILGLHPTSAEFHFRFASSIANLFSLTRFQGLGQSFVNFLNSIGYSEDLKDLLKGLGYVGNPPDIQSHFFYADQGKLQGVLVDEPQHSETERLRTASTAGENYIQWLIRFAHKDLDAVRQQVEFIDKQPPKALLYLLLRHAVHLGYHEAAYKLFERAGTLSPQRLNQLKREPDFVHLFAPTAETGRSESRWAPLYDRTSNLKIPLNSLIHEFIAQLLRGRDPAFQKQAADVVALDRQLRALEFLKEKPIARLERALVEHLDCCTYRFDAWRQGIVHLQLAHMRYKEDREQIKVARDGIYLGAYGWLENVRSENKVLKEKELNGDLATAFANVQPAFTDSTNGGFIHAPSPNQAVTAAVLRNGYLSQATPQNHQTLQVNLSSERMRVALSFLEGMRQGQSLGALLGYQLERGLHDRRKELMLDAIIYDLRKQFPLRANQLEATKVENVPIEKLEARNVIDGLKLIEQTRLANQTTYPFGLPVSAVTPISVPGVLPQLSAAQKAAVDAEVQRLLNIHDAMADLAMAESVHQAAQGNYDRAAATLETFTLGNHPPEPSVIRTPSQGITLTHRVGIHLQPGLSPPNENATPRSMAEPAVNHWLRSRLPALDQIACKVEWKDPITGHPANHVVTLADLNLQPIDLLTLLRLESDESMSELDGRVLNVVHTRAHPRIDADLKILYLNRGRGQWSFAEVSPLVRTLASLISAARPLTATDLTLHSEAVTTQDESSSVNALRVTSVRDALSALINRFAAFQSELQPFIEQPQASDPVHRATLPGQIDHFLQQLIGLLNDASNYGIPQSGTSFLFTWRQQRSLELVDSVSQLLKRWQGKLDRYTQTLSNYAALPEVSDDEVRFAMLQAAEGEVSTQLLPRPNTPNELRQLVIEKGNAFQARRAAFEQLITAPLNSLAEFVASIEALLPITNEDFEVFDLAKTKEAFERFVVDMHQVAAVVETELKRRQQLVQTHLSAHDATTAAVARVDALTSAAQAMLGDDFQLIPEFSVTASQASEWSNSLQAVRDGKLLHHLVSERDVDFPIDQWLYGIARVREPMRQWERLVMLTDALQVEDPELVPAQFPYQDNDSWLGLDYPADYVIHRDRLLYTAHYSTAIETDALQCGLLIDEWTEQVLTQDADTHQVTHDSAISFHYDRPNTEAPQTWLLVTSAGWKDNWQWDELVQAVLETFDAAKSRAVEPEHIDGPFSQILPAVVMASTATEISISTYLARNNPKFDS